MIIIKSGERVIYHPLHPQLKLVGPKLTLEDNAAGSLTFKVYGDNMNQGSIRKLFPLITVYRDGTPIFRGRAIRDMKDFRNGRSVEVEGQLALFNDSCLEPFSFQGSPEELFRMIVENHNAQVMPWQRLKVGKVTVRDSNDYIVRSSEGTLDTWAALKEKCFRSSLGGHIRIRYEDDGDYVDWLSDYEKVSAQSIAFARNIISLSQESDASETYTAIRPVGAEVDGKKVDISSVNGGRTYLVNEERAAECGIIFAPVEESVWEDVTLPENLLKKAREQLYGSMAALSESYEVKAVDLHLTDPEVEALDICEYVPVVSRPHGIDGNYLLTRADISIASPQDSVYHLGASRRVLSGMGTGGGGQQEAVPQKVSALENDAGYISEEKAGEMLAEDPKEERVEEIVKEAVTLVPAGEDGFSPTIAESPDNTADMYRLDITDKNGSRTTPNLKGADGINGRDGMNGFSPVIAENPENTVDVYRLDITDKNGSRTTPNLKGADGEGTEALGGLVFGQDSEGNWGYIPPGADTVIPFKKGGESGGGSGVEVKGWANLARFHPAIALVGISAVDTESIILVGSAWKKVNA